MKLKASRCDIWISGDYSNAVATSTLEGTIEPIDLFENIPGKFFCHGEKTLALVFKPLKGIQGF